VALSAVGFAGLLWIALGPLLAIIARRPLVLTSALTAGCVWSADLTTLLVKSLVDRPRPFRDLPEADPLLRGDIGSSFPSGHAATSFAGALVLAYLVRRWLVALVALAALVAASRVYVGVHYPLDVLGGAALGALYAGAFALLIQTLRARRRTSGAPLRSGAGPPAG